jgi:hypothetical protein
MIFRIKRNLFQTSLFNRENKLTFDYFELYWILMNFRYRKIIVWPMCLVFLTGIIFSGNANILCIGDNGYIKLETFCQARCDEADTPSESHNELAECSDCSDIDFNSPIWLKRNQILYSKDLINLVSPFNNDVDLTCESSENTISHNIKHHLIYGQSPPYYSLMTAVLRC